MSDAEWGPWIGWNGGECPVDGDAMVNVVFKGYPESDGSNPFRGDVKACLIAWYHDGANDDVVAYRVKKTPEVVVNKPECVLYVRGQDFGIEVVHDLNPELTYTDGKLTKVYWEAE